MIGRKLRQSLAQLFSAAALFWLTATPINTQEFNMTDQRPGLNYTININAENMLVKVYINDAPMLFHGTFKEVYSTRGIGDFIQPGTNRIVIDYEPFDMDKQAFTPHEGVALQIKLSRRSKQEILIDDNDNISVTRPDLVEEVDLFSGRYDLKTGQLQPTQKAIFPQVPLVRRDGGLVVSGTFTTKPVTMVYSNRTSEGNAQRLIFTFDINDVPMPTPPWVNAPPLTDTSELRAELWQAYQQMHRIIAARDEEAYRREVRLVFAHGALTRGYRDAEGFADALFKKRPFVDTPDERVAPLPPQTSGQIEFGLGPQRIVRFFPNPIQYETENGESSGSHSFFFCRQPQGHLAVCYVKDIPYR